MLAKKLTERPLTEIAFHCIPDASGCNHPEAACGALINRESTALKNKRPAQDTFTLIADLLKFARFTQTLRSRDAHGSVTSFTLRLRRKQRGCDGPSLGVQQEPCGHRVLHYVRETRIYERGEVLKVCMLVP